MSPQQREALAAQCRLMIVKLDRIRGELARLASEPDRDLVRRLALEVVVDAAVLRDIAE